MRAIRVRMLRVAHVTPTLSRCPAMSVHSLGLANRHRPLQRLRRAPLGTGKRLRDVEWNRILEEQLVSRNAMAKLRMQDLARLQWGVPMSVEITANSALACNWPHSDLCIDEVGPAVNLHVHPMRKCYVHDFVGQICHGVIHENAIFVVCDCGCPTVSCPKMGQRLSPITSYFACI